MIDLALVTASVLALVAVRNAAKVRGRDTFSYVMFCFFITPLVVGFLLVTLGDRPNAKLPSEEERTRLARINAVLIVVVVICIAIELNSLDVF